MLLLQLSILLTSQIILILIMSSYQQWKQKLSWIWEQNTQRNALKLLGVTSFMACAFFGFRFYNQQRGATVIRIQQIHDLILKNQQKAYLSRQSLVLEQTHTSESNNIIMQFLLVSKLKEKQRQINELVRNPFLPPFQQGLFIKQLGQTHRLLFNKFNLYQNHLLVVTKQFQPQSNLLNKDDFKNAILAFRAVKGLFFYNSGPKAGASQTHKHIQIFPNEAKDLPMLRSILEYCRQLKYKQDQRYENDNPQQLQIKQFPPFNFKHGLILIGNKNNSLSQNDKGKSGKGTSNDQSMSKLKENTLKAYEKLYNHFYSNLQKGQQLQDYNLIGCQHFLMLIPRRKEKAFNDISVNAIGFMGSVLFKDKNLLRKYISQNRQGYQILEDITYPKKD